MEYVDGKPLYQCIWKYKDGSGRLPEHVAKFFAAQLVLAVRALHTGGFVHRDLKSGNVLVDHAGFVKVIDFGFAKQLAAHGAGPTRVHSLCGTHYIIAPEVFTRSASGFAADWWCVPEPLWRSIQANYTEGSLTRTISISSMLPSYWSGVSAL